MGDGSITHHTHMYRSWQNVESIAQEHAILPLPIAKRISNDKVPAPAAACKLNLLTILQFTKSSQTHGRTQQTALAKHMLICCCDGVDASMVSTRYGKDFSAIEMGGCCRVSYKRGLQEVNDACFRQASDKAALSPIPFPPKGYKSHMSDCM